MDSRTGAERGGGAWLILGAGLLVGLALGLLAFFGIPSANENRLAAANSGGSAGGPAPGPFVGAPAPDFELDSIAGDRVRLSALKGSPVLINFWFTTCGPCRVEMPAIESRYRQYRDDGLRVLAVNFDEPASDVAAYARDLGLTFDILLDPGARVQVLYRVRGYPTSYFVDARGVIQVAHVGLMTESQLDGYLEKVGLRP